MIARLPRHLAYIEHYREEYFKITVVLYVPNTISKSVLCFVLGSSPRQELQLPRTDNGFPAFDVRDISLSLFCDDFQKQLQITFEKHLYRGKRAAHVIEL